MADNHSEPSSPSSLRDSPILLVTNQPDPNEPPPPYPSQNRRPRRGRRARAQLVSPHDSDYDGIGASQTTRPLIAVRTNGHHVFPAEDHEANENTPLLGSPRSSVRRHSGFPVVVLGVQGRPRTVSHSSTIRSNISGSPSLAQTLFSAFQPELDSDLDGTEELHDEEEPRHPVHLQLPSESLNEPECGPEPEQLDWKARWKRYFRPMGRRAYYSAILHLLVLNFPFALAAWVYLFVFTLTGTILLMALPLGALLCFLDLLGARAFARAELSLQSTFHGPLAFIPHPARPIFHRLRQPTLSELESGRLLTYDTSFYRNAYAMFTDSISYQALFYFLVIKPSITLSFGLLLIVLVPVSFVLVLPAPAMLRIVRRLGIWQANVAVEGLYLAVR